MTVPRACVKRTLDPQKVEIIEQLAFSVRKRNRGGFFGSWEPASCDAVKIRGASRTYQKRRGNYRSLTGTKTALCDVANQTNPPQLDRPCFSPKRETERVSTPTTCPSTCLAMAGQIQSGVTESRKTLDLMKKATSTKARITRGSEKLKKKL